MEHKIEYGAYTFHSNDTVSIGTTGDLSVVSEPLLNIDTFTAVVVCKDAGIIQFKVNERVIYSQDSERKGVYYLRSIDRLGEDTYQLNAATPLARLAKTQHNGGIYEGTTVSDVVAEICGDIPYIVKQDMQEIKLYGWLPISNGRDNLAQVAFATGGTVKTDLNGILRFEWLWGGISNQHKAGTIYQDVSVETSAPVTRVDLTEHRYIRAGSTEASVLFEGTAQEGDKITFSGPVYNLSATGFEIREENANYAILSAGTGTLTGTEYVHTTRTVSRTIQKNAVEPNIITVENATLVTVTNSGTVADRLAEYYKHNETIDASVVYNNEKPGDVIRFYHPYDHAMREACIEQMDLTMSGFTKAAERLVTGYVPPKSDAEFITRHEVLTYESYARGATKWIVPAGVKEVHVVCIGGGNGGYAGGHGENGGNGPSSHQATTAGTGGAGGSGGAKGESGRVHEGVMSVTYFQDIEYRIGAGGKGGKPYITEADVEWGTDGNKEPGLTQGDNLNPTNGEETGFGSISSRDGAVMEDGYTDVVTGKRYAIPAESDGISGGAGGGSNGEAASVTFPNGITFRGGFNGKNYSGTYWSGGGYGGGAAIGWNGWSVLSGHDGTSNAGGRGGHGAPARYAGAGYINSFFTPWYGQGGSGGHGGGGGGGGGYGAGGDTWASALPGGSGGEGGHGSAGGDGAPGCIILTYVQEKQNREMKTGPFLDKNGIVLLDRYGRLFVV